MSDRWAVNASPLILLAKVGQIHLLPKLAGELVIPASVVAEIGGGPASDPARSWLAGDGAVWIQPDAPTVPAVAAWDLGAGETAVLSWAWRHRHFEAILDDRAARKCATIERLPVRGTLGVILAGKVRGFVPNARTICDDIVRAGLRIHPDVLREALKLVGE